MIFSKPAGILAGGEGVIGYACVKDFSARVGARRVPAGKALAKQQLRQIFRRVFFALLAKLWLGCFRSRQFKPKISAHAKTLHKPLRQRMKM